MSVRIEINSEIVDILDDLDKLALRRKPASPMKPRGIYEIYAQAVPSAAPYGIPFSAARDVRLARSYLRKTYPSLPASERDRAARRAVEARTDAHEVASILRRAARAHMRGDVYGVVRLLDQACLVELNRFGSSEATERLAVQMFTLKD